jgi:hypothetical protein
MAVMPFPIRICAVCEEEFELKPDKPGFANRCPECSEPEATGAAAPSGGAEPVGALERKIQAEADEARRQAIRELLYSRK